MCRSLLAGLVLATILAAVITAAGAADTEVVYVSATECRGEHHDYRWDVKSDQEAPPERISPENQVKPSDIGKWPAPRGAAAIKSRTPRSDREKEWFEVTGCVKLVKAEADGDLHIQLVDMDNANSVNVVVEVPVKEHSDESPWDATREEVFSWSDRKFPFRTKSGEKLTLNKHPVIQVEGKAFFDAMHAQHVPGQATNRRKAEGSGVEVAVWEIHPVMSLKIVGD